MEKTDHINDQTVLLTALLEATHKDYYSDPEAKKGDIVAGANATNFSFRNNGSGIPLEQMVRSLFPMEGESNPMSAYYPIEDLLCADLLEVHSFINKEHAFVRFEKGKRTLFNIEPDETAPEGILIRIEYHGKVDRLLEPADVQECMKATSHPWRPVMFYNGNKVDWYGKVVNK